MIQNDIFDDKKFQCEDHPQHSIKLISYSDKCNYKRRFICVICLLEKQQDLQSIISFQQVNYIKSIVYFQSHLVFRQEKEFEEFTKKNNTFEIMLKKLEELEIQLAKCQQYILKKLSCFKQEIQTLKKIQLQNQMDFTKQLKINEFQKQLCLVWNMDTHQGTKEFEHLEQSLNELLANWRDCCNRKSSEIANSQIKIYQDITSIQQLWDDDIKQEQKIFENLKQFIPYNNYCSDIKLFVHNEISKGRRLRYDLIYSGIRDGLTLEIYHKKTDLQEQLLTIISLKNPNIIGAQTPLQLNSSLNKWLVDDSKLSFIFQQNKEEIYKLKNETYTVYCDKQYGPWYGNSGEIGMRNFNVLTSDYFGFTYDITGYKVENKQTHLIGEKDTEINECKVYKITFL